MTRHPAPTDATPSRRTAVLLLATVALVPFLSGPQPAAAQETPPAATLISPDQLADALEGEEAFVVNVHIPYEGEIEGTDASIPFDAIDPAALPADKDAEIILYCMSGNMSATAAESLAALGYTQISDLEGGMNAWVASGRDLVTR